MVEGKGFERTKLDQFQDHKKLGTYILKTPVLTTGTTATEILLGMTDKKELVVAKCYDTKTNPKVIEQTNKMATAMGMKSLHNKASEKVYYIQDFANAGSLDKYIKRGMIFNKSMLESFILQVSKQLAVLHAHEVYHGELTPEQILVHMDEHGKPHYRLCGFGHYIPKPEKFYEDPTVRPYLPPKQLCIPTPATSEAAKKDQLLLEMRNDVWSFGMIVFQLATKVLPFTASGDFDDGLLVRNSGTFPPYLLHLLLRCLKERIDDRITAEEIPYQAFFFPTRTSTLPYVLDSATLGHGHFAEVRLCHNKNDPNKVYAVKILKPLNELDEKYQMLVLGEIAVLIKLRGSPYTLNLVDYFFFENKLHLVLEFCNKGDLESYWTGLYTTSPVKPASYPDEMMLISYHLAAGIKAMHSKKIIHRDIKPKNLLMITDERRHWLIDVKLSDFGTSREALQPAETHVGTPGFLAPEIIAQDPYSEKVDVWSYGITLFCLLFLQPPQALDKTQNIYKAKKIKYPTTTMFEMNPHFFKLMQHCLDFDPTKRYNIDQVLNDPYFKTCTIKEKKTFETEYKCINKGAGLYEHVASKMHHFVKVLDSAHSTGPALVGLTESIALHLRLRPCENVVRLYEYFKFNNNLMLVFDAWDLTLEAFVKGSRTPEGNLPMALLKSIGLDIARTLADLHAREVFHKRLTPTTIFIVKGPKVKVLLGGVSELTYEDNKTPFVPKELDNTSEGSNENAEVMKYGLLLYWLAFGQFILTPGQSFENILKFPDTTKYTKIDFLNLVNLIKKCLQPKDRISSSPSLSFIIR